MCGRQAVYKLSFAESVFSESGMVTLLILAAMLQQLGNRAAVYASLHLRLSCMSVLRLLVL